ncbi:hypothetical protein MRX96_015130 [Rhipicephalus microplus]
MAPNEATNLPIRLTKSLGGRTGLNDGNSAKQAERARAEVAFLSAAVFSFYSGLSAREHRRPSPRRKTSLGSGDGRRGNSISGSRSPIGTLSPPPSRKQRLRAFFGDALSARSAEDETENRNPRRGHRTGVRFLAQIQHELIWRKCIRFAGAP